ncbi:keratin, type I cytoskeletal 9-like [Belonocnema kinseyi]|uniref:keratin, type I cytoskeletal 9-like n=1 Tax=Belonocnema kinseyi TaxID=2817044 RepID=UPI00143DC40C|nr:keratin, type I cytoskeletal 9-like [Belonocnema kinseyi]
MKAFIVLACLAVASAHPGLSHGGGYGGSYGGLGGHGGAGLSGGLAAGAGTAGSLQGGASSLGSGGLGASYAAGDLEALAASQEAQESEVDTMADMEAMVNGKRVNTSVISARRQRKPPTVIPVNDP